MMKQLYFLLLLAAPFLLKAQSVGIGANTPSSSAMLEVSSPNKGILIPRMNSNTRTAIINPAVGLMVYDTDTKSIWNYSGTAWQNGSPGSKERSIWIPAESLSYNTSFSGLTKGQWGLILANNATVQPGFVVPQPVDWDKSLPFSVTIYYSVPSFSTSISNTIISWRLQAGGNRANSTSGDASTGWDSYQYSTYEDAAPASIPATYSYFELAKTQTWTAKWSATYGTWYLGAGVNTATAFSSNPIWHFMFQRGYAANNGEGYTGPLTINGISVNYTAK